MNNSSSSHCSQLPLRGLCSSPFTASSNQSIDIDEGIPEVALWQRAAPVTDLRRKAATGEGLVLTRKRNEMSLVPTSLWQYRGTDPVHLGLISFSTDRKERYPPLTINVLKQLKCVDTPSFVSLNRISFCFIFNRVTWRYGPVNVGIHTASKSSPVVDDETVYVGADDERLYAVDRRTGELKWRFFTRPTKNGIHGTPAVDQQYVFIGDYGNFFF
jgi:hypothetical protein